MLKRCTNCGLEKELSEFRKQTRNKDGLHPHCKECSHSAYAKWYANNKDWVKNYQETHKDDYRRRAAASRAHNPEQHRARVRRYRERHPERVKARLERWRNGNREHLLAYAREYAAQHPVRRAQNEATRRAKRWGAAIGQVDYEAALATSGLLCYLCHLAVEPEDVEFDHVLPLSRGGHHATENIGVTHESCNRRKHNKLISELAGVV